MKHYADLNVNPCKMCMPMGASLAFQGIEDSMVIIHGSQGCSTYIRRHMSGHFNEPVDIASSSLTEEATVYGGAVNLKAGILNLIKLYQPKVIGVLTSCLAETIGEDIKRIVKEIRLSEADQEAIKGVDIIPVPTPGYGGSQTEGYYAAVKALAMYYNPATLADEPCLDTCIPISKKRKKVNLIVGSATCEDIRELYDICEAFELEVNLVPDISDALDAPFHEAYLKLNPYGTSVEALKALHEADATIEFGILVDEQYSPGLYLFEQFDVSLYRLPMPVGIEFTDRLMDTLALISGKKIPLKYEKQRGRLIDAMIDSHKHNAMGKAAVYGDMELTYSVTQLCRENGILPLIAATGTPNANFRFYVNQIMAEMEINGSVMEDTDFLTIRQVVVEKDVNILIGNSDGKFIWEKEDIDLVRVGFPIHDHVGGQRLRVFSYNGTMALLDRITNTLLDQKHHGYREKLQDTYLTKEVVNL